MLSYTNPKNLTVQNKPDNIFLITFICTLHLCLLFDLEINGVNLMASFTPSLHKESVAGSMSNISKESKMFKLHILD